LLRGYCRVSTDLQLDGVSLDVQEARIAQYCCEHSYTLAKVYKEAVSGKDTANRAQLQLLLDEVQAREIVVVVDLSRLSRTTLHALQLIDRFSNMNVGFVAITQPFDTTTPVGEAMMVVQMSFNQLERKNTAAKVKCAMQTLKAQGKLRTRPPFGWKFAGKENDYEPEAEQQRVLETIKSLHANGISMTRIAANLNFAGDHRCLLNKKKQSDKFAGAIFHQTTIKRILVENGVLVGSGSYAHRKPVASRIVSHHK